MSRIRSQDTIPELLVRSLVHRMGYRFRLHEHGMPGKPDLVLRSRREVIFVHGCFWHQHQRKSCPDGRLPKSRRDYWVPKLAHNQERDRRNLRKLRRMGWRALVVWECEAERAELMSRKLARFFCEKTSGIIREHPGRNMPIARIHSFLVHPSKHAEEQPDISGTSVPLRGKLFNMLNGVYDRARTECDIEIVFRPDEAGWQNNECRDLLVTYARQPTIVHGRTVAERLQHVSTNRSGLGLLFLMTGVVDDQDQLVISRFPADQGVVAQEHARQLTVEFIERVFMKSAKAYKSAIYKSDSFARGFWDGHAVDRQISGPRELSDYWIREFLVSELRTTGPAGTRRLAIAFRDAIRATADLEVREELISAANLLRRHDGRRGSTRQLLDRLDLTGEAAGAIESAFSRPDLVDQTFQFDMEEYRRHAPYRSVELDNGGVLIAENARFDDVFVQEPVDDNNGRTRYTTVGRIVDERLRKQK